MAEEEFTIEEETEFLEGDEGEDNAVRVTLSDTEDDTPLSDFRTRFDRICARIPAEFLQKSRVTFFGYLHVYYERPPTAEEEAEFEAENTACNEERERKDRAEYERLKAKYEASCSNFLSPQQKAA